jgi:triosephosphate isomerase
MRQTVIAGNWKMNLNLAAGQALVRALCDAAASFGSVQVGVAPAFPYLRTAVEACSGSPIFVAGQDLHEQESGAFTGDVSGPMLRDLGVSHVIVGHSERRRIVGESNERVGQKLRAALQVGLIPILCVGETLDERREQRMEEVLVGQMDAALEGLTETDLHSLIIAYEPVWAIGTGENATPEQAGEAHSMLRNWMVQRFSNSYADSVRIQYGGSVKPGNAGELLRQQGVDGALVGGASLDAGSFLGILQACQTPVGQSEA